MTNFIIVQRVLSIQLYSAARHNEWITVMIISESAAVFWHSSYITL